ncbi:inner membrane transport permease YadH [Escherichia coli]|nr:inner membrane transport permease YadH [Escherichia coli]
MMHLYWVALKSIWAKEIHRFMRIWVQTLVPPVITMTLYFIIFGNLIGSRIGDMHGFSYMQFIVPGADHDVGDHQCLRQRCVIIFWCQVPA